MTDLFAAAAGQQVDPDQRRSYQDLPDPDHGRGIPGPRPAHPAVSGGAGVRPDHGAARPAAPAAPRDQARPAPMAPRLLAGLRPAGPALTLAEHLTVHGPRPELGGNRRAALLRAVRDVGLRGRGGAGFPFADKVDAVLAARSRRPPRVVVNGAESEPGSRKDQVLLGGSPHLVLDGALLAAELVGAREVTVRLPAGSPLVLVLEEAAGRDDRITVAPGGSGYTSGESSAVVAALSGRPARPTQTPPHAAERGVKGDPTLLSNSETLAQLALIARHGPYWYAQQGTADEPGTLLVTVAGGVRRRQAVAELPFGAPLRDAVALAEPVERPQAVLIGGYAGTWLPWPTAERARLSRASLTALGADLGVGLLAVLPASRCGVAETARLVGWLASQNAGQCGPCVNGLPAIAAVLSDLAVGAAVPESMDRLVRWTGMVDGRGLCRHPDGVAALVHSALRCFDAEVRAHLAGQCSGRVDARPAFPLPPPATRAPVREGLR